MHVHAYSMLALADNTAIQNGESYEEVIRRAEKLFKRIRFSVAQQSAPTTLKSAFLDPLKTRLGLEVALEIFARTDADFMAMFTGKRKHVRACMCVCEHGVRAHAYKNSQVKGKWVQRNCCSPGGLANQARQYAQACREPGPPEERVPRAFQGAVRAVGRERVVLAANQDLRAPFF
eukprot:1150672-Pelagomonas_calceolata.AAC.7